MEKRSSHYKVSRAQFVLIDRVVIYPGVYQIHAKCTLAVITLGVWDEAFLNAGVCDDTVVHKLAPLAFIWGHVAFT